LLRHSTSHVRRFRRSTAIASTRLDEIRRIQVFERFAKEARETVRRAAEIAESESAALVQSEHLLLALLDPPRERVGRALVNAGITADRVREARDREFRSALVSVGVHTERRSPASSSRLKRGRTTRFATSARLALERTLELCVEAGDRRITNGHLLSAIAQAEVGRTPAIIEELGTTRDELARLASSA
jgi:ATP-dependent Clp protease ATP-binding subunit ClpA